MRPAQQLAQRRLRVGHPGFGQWPARDQQQVPLRRDLGRHDAGRLTQQALGPVAINRWANRPPGQKAKARAKFGHGDAARRPHREFGRAAPPSNKNDKRVGVRSSIAPHPLEIGCALQVEQGESSEPTLRPPAAADDGSRPYFFVFGRPAGDLAAFQFTFLM